MQIREILTAPQSPWQNPSRPCPRAQREASPPSRDPLRRLLSWRSNSPLTGEGSAGRQAHRAAGDGPRYFDSRSGWSASSLRPASGVVQHRLAGPRRPTARDRPHSSLLTVSVLHMRTFVLPGKADGLRLPTVLPPAVSASWPGQRNADPHQASRIPFGEGQDDSRFSWCWVDHRPITILARDRSVLLDEALDMVTSSRPHR
jgi:hypothetical protein